MYCMYGQLFGQLLNKLITSLHCSMRRGPPSGLVKQNKSNIIQYCTIKEGKS
jgi:hypothetical protein